MAQLPNTHSAYNTFWQHEWRVIATIFCPHMDRNETSQPIQRTFRNFWSADVMLHNIIPVLMHWLKTMFANQKHSQSIHGAIGGKSRYLAKTPVQYETQRARIYIFLLPLSVCNAPVRATPPVKAYSAHPIYIALLPVSIVMLFTFALQ